jgi:predicted HAD superfamily hydrolase
MEENGYVVKNTNGEDLDNNQTALQTESYTVFTAFEIFEHLLNPYTILENVKRQITYFYSAVCGFLQLIAVKQICGIGITTNLKIGNWIGY